MFLGPRVWNLRSLIVFTYCYFYFYSQIPKYLCPMAQNFWFIRHTLYVLNSANLACITHYCLSPSAHIYSVHNLKMWDSYYLIHSWMVVSSIFLMLTCNTPFYENLFLGSYSNCDKMHVKCQVTILCTAWKIAKRLRNSHTYTLFLTQIYVWIWLESLKLTKIQLRLQ